MSYEEPNFDENMPDDGQLPEESNNNRTFLIAAGILGGIILISIACLVGVYLFTQNSNAQIDEQAVAATQTAQVASNFINDALTATFQASILPTATEPPTATSVVNVATVTPTTGTSVANAGTPAAATATVGAALTQAAIAQLTIVPTTTALPKTGFVEDVGVPGLVVMALAFIIVILMARRLRAVPVR
ncbi:MAG: hypothetical protein HYU84_05375 [Chloroflexi bacterium]|nr:hypothetical protein [Chloroflexota bacterium]MBI3167773.1 hypothetical protein [Chloroflexota bacterium]